MKRRKMVLAVLLASALSAEGAMTGAMTVQAAGADAGFEGLLVDEEKPDMLKESCFTVDENGNMTLSGVVVKDAVSKYANKDQVTSIVALEGTILPADSSYLFDFYTNVVNIDLSNANTENVTDIHGMFLNCVSLKSLNLSGFNTSNVTRMEYMFQTCSSIEEIDLSSFDTSNVTAMNQMFHTCTSLKKVNISKFNTQNVTNMIGMFDRCKNLESLDLSNFDTSNSMDLSSMFIGCENLKNLNVSSFDTSKARDVSNMFADCKLLTELDLGNFKVTDETITGSMFYNCEKLSKLTLGANFPGVTEYMSLPNKIGWNCGTGSDKVSGDGDNAVFVNRGKNTYHVFQELTGSAAIEGIAKYSGSLKVRVKDSNAENFGYQWKREGVNIADATDIVYIPTKEDIGKKLTCEVRSTDGWLAGTIVSSESAVIEKMDGPAAPAGLEALPVSGEGKADGKITGTLETYEYSTTEDFSADVKDCSPVELTGLKEGTYYFRIKETETMKAGEVTKVVVSRQGAKVTDIFSDVIKGEWYVDSVQFVYDRGIMSGMLGGIFGTKDVLTRAQFVTVLHNMEGKPEMEYTEQFTDVPDDEWYTQPILWAYENKITAGVDAKLFGTNNKITREQLATMLYKYANYKEYTTTVDTKALENFPDTKEVSDWAEEAMQWAVTNKVMQGKKASKGNILDPKGEATRAECAQMIRNMLENTVKVPAEDTVETKTETTAEDADKNAE